MIATLNNMKWIMLTVLLTLGFSAYVYGSGYWLTPASEWAVTLIYVNFFSVLSFTNKFYDTISPSGKML
jgi:hypothetical protein